MVEEKQMTKRGPINILHEIARTVVILCIQGV